MEGHRGLSLSPSPGSAKDPGLQDGIPPSLLSLPCQGFATALTGGIFLFHFQSKMILPPTQVASRCPLCVLGWALGSQEKADTHRGLA